MTDNDLPPDLARLEALLVADPCRPGPSLRGRVMAGVHKELLRSKRQESWQYLAALAASVLLLLNLSLTATLTSPHSPGLDRSQLSALCQQAEEMHLDLPREEIQRQCLLLAAGRELTLYGRPYGRAIGTSTALND